MRPPRQEEIEREPIGTLDVRDGEHLLLQMTSPFGDRVVLGRNGDATWAILPDGTVDNYPPRRAWPKWVDFGSSTVLMVSVEDLLASLKEGSYELKKHEAEALPSGKGPKCYRIGAIRKPEPSPEPSRVELWIDPETRVVKRMELHWPPPPGRGPEGRPPPGPDGRPPPGRDGRPPPGPDGRPPPPPDGAPPPGPDGRPPPGPDGRPPPGPDGRPPPRMGPDGRPRPPHPPPEFLGGPPDFARRPPPPRTLVFELVEGVKFEPGWFESGAHVK